MFDRLGSSVEMIADSFYALYRNPLNNWRLVRLILYCPHPIEVYLHAVHGPTPRSNIRVYATHAVCHGKTYKYPPVLLEFLRESWKYPDLFGYLPRSGCAALSFLNACVRLQSW